MPGNSSRFLLAYAITWSMFMVLCCFAIESSTIGIMRTRQRTEITQLGSTSIAPDNLPLAAEMFRTSIPVQDPSFPVDSMTRLPAWKTLQATLDAYRARLKLLDAHNAELDHRLQSRSIFISIAALVMVLANLVVVLIHRWRSGGATRAAGATPVPAVA
jgi:hypothetical protein